MGGGFPMAAVECVSTSEVVVSAARTYVVPSVRTGGGEVSKNEGGRTTTEGVVQRGDSDIRGRGKCRGGGGDNSGTTITEAHKGRGSIAEHAERSGCGFEDAEREEQQESGSRLAGERIWGAEPGRRY